MWQIITKQCGGCSCQLVVLKPRLGLGERRGTLSAAPNQPQATSQLFANAKPANGRKNSTRYPERKVWWSWTQCCLLPHFHSNFPLYLLLLQVGVSYSFCRSLCYRNQGRSGLVARLPFVVSRRPYCNLIRLVHFILTGPPRFFLASFSFIFILS